MRKTPKEIQQAVMTWDLELISQLDQEELKRQLLSLYNNSQILAVAALSASDAIKTAINSQGETAFVAVLTKIVFFYYESFMDKKDERIQDLAILLSSISARLKDNAEVVVGLINQLCPPEVSAATNQSPPETVEKIEDENEDTTYHNADDVVEVVQIIDASVQHLTLEELSSSASDDTSDDSSKYEPSATKNTSYIAVIASPVVSADTKSAATATSTATGKNNSAVDFFRRVNSTPAMARSASSDDVKKERTSSHSGRRRKIRHNNVANDKEVALTNPGSSNSASKKAVGVFTVFAPPTLPRPPSEPPPAYLLAASASSGSAVRSNQPARTGSNEDGPLLVTSARIIRRSSSRLSIGSKPADLTGDDESSASSSRSRRSSRRRKDDNNELTRKSLMSRGNSSGEDTQFLVRNNSDFFKPILDLEEDDMMSAEDLPKSQSHNCNN